MVKRSGVLLGPKAGATVAWLALTVPTVSLAVPPTVNVSLDNRYSDNVAQTAANEVSDTESREPFTSASMAPALPLSLTMPSGYNRT